MLGLTVLSIWNNNFGDKIIEVVGPHAEDVAEKVDFELFPVNQRFYNGSLRRLIVDFRNQNFSAEGCCQLLGCVLQAVVVNILGCVRPIKFQLFEIRIKLGPQIERLPADNKRPVFQHNVGSDRKYGLGS